MTDNYIYKLLTISNEHVIEIGIMGRTSANRLGKRQLRNQMSMRKMFPCLYFVLSILASFFDLSLLK